MDRLSLVNIFVRDIEALPDFYATVFDLAEETALRTAIFRAMRAGGALIGFNGPQAYGLLGLALPGEYLDAGSGGPRTGGEPAGVARFALTFDVPSPAEVAPRTQRAVSLGASLVKGPYTTHYGTIQAVLFDPEGNVFRINATI